MAKDAVATQEEAPRTTRRAKSTKTEVVEKVYEVEKDFSANFTLHTKLVGAQTVTVDRGAHKHYRKGERHTADEFGRHLTRALDQGFIKEVDPAEPHVIQIG